MKRILLLEREYNLTQTLLKDTGFSVDTATSAELALGMIERDRYHALVLDPKNQNGQIPDLIREANKIGLRAIIATSIPREQLNLQGDYHYFVKPLNTKPAFFELLNS